jgi:signal peptidase I
MSQTSSDNSSNNTPTDLDQSSNSGSKIKKEIATIALIIFAILVFRSSFFEPFKIPSGSMIPTLLVGDFILVNKFSYGFKVPFSDWYTDPVYISQPSKPKRGDIIVFKYPVDPSLNYIKRVVAIPGDKIKVTDKIIYLNDQPISESDVPSEDLMKELTDQNADLASYGLRVLSTKNGDTTHLIQQISPPTELSNTEELIVPDNHYFVMGDNRDNSQDSRKWGFVPFENIKGKAFLVWFNLNIPFPKDERLNYPFLFHPNRIGKLIE